MENKYIVNGKYTMSYIPNLLNINDKYKQCAYLI